MYTAKLLGQLENTESGNGIRERERKERNMRMRRALNNGRGQLFQWQKSVEKFDELQCLCFMRTVNK